MSGDAAAQKLIGVEKQLAVSSKFTADDYKRQCVELQASGDAAAQKLIGVEQQLAASKFTADDYRRQCVELQASGEVAIKKYSKDEFAILLSDT